MNSTFEQLSKIIRNNAQNLLKKTNIDSVISKTGELFYTGSFALDLMTWNDIDMQVVLKDGIDPIVTMNHLMAFITKDPGFLEAQIINFSGDYKKKMPRGVYLGVKLNYPEFGGEWKLDLWSLDKKCFDSNRFLIASLHDKLDIQSKNLILEMKHEMMAETGRVPQMGSHFLYQAVLLEGIREKERLYQYFDSKGINIKK